jgi:geranylgeranyl pyrophosphate synthase
MTARAAAMISPTDEGTVEAMRDFGYQIGMAFQIVDDILDFNGEQNAVGKPLGSDLLNGLVTLPAIYYAEAHPNDEDVLSLPQGGWTNVENMTRLIEKIRSSDAAKKSMQEAEAHVDRALARIASLDPSTEREALESLAKYIVDRRV